MVKIIIFILILRVRSMSLATKEGFNQITKNNKTGLQTNWIIMGLPTFVSALKLLKIN